MQDNIYFDIWRKAKFSDLLRPYAKTFLVDDRRTHAHVFATYMDLYFPSGKGQYTQDNWRSAYIIAREFAVYYDTQDGGISLSNVAADFLNSKITSREYVANYLLNFNQAVYGVVVHPFRETLRLFEGGRSSIERHDIRDIEVFRLTRNGLTPESANQQASILFNRISDSSLLELEGRKLKVGKYTTQTLIEHCRVWPGSATDVPEQGSLEYIDMIAHPNTLIYR